MIYLRQALSRGKLRRGQPIQAEHINELYRRTARRITGPGVTESESGWAIRPVAATPQATQSVAAFAMITSKMGVLPPFRYAALQATLSESGAWSTPADPLAYENVYNLEEQGTGGQWVNPLNIGDAVLIFPSPDPTVNAFICIRAHYRGTY